MGIRGELGLAVGLQIEMGSLCAESEEDGFGHGLSEMPSSKWLPWVPGFLYFFLRGLLLLVCAFSSLPGLKLRGQALLINLVAASVDAGEGHQPRHVTGVANFPCLPAPVHSAQSVATDIQALGCHNHATLIAYRLGRTQVMSLFWIINRILEVYLCLLKRPSDE